MYKIVVTIVFLSVIWSSCELSHKDNSMAEIISNQKLLDMVNNLRTEGCDCGNTYMPPVKELKWDKELERAATAHSIDMNTQGYFSHTSLDGSTFADRVNGTDYEGRPTGENIASGQSTEEAVFNSWRQSDGHCRNMMNQGHTDMAVGRSGNYWTMVFGSR